MFLPVLLQRELVLLLVLVCAGWSFAASAQTVSVFPAGSQAQRTGKSAANVPVVTMSIGPRRAAANAAMPQVATPQLSVAAGYYATAQSVQITEATAGATVYYTTDGSTPTTSSSVYTGPVAITKTGPLVVMAHASGYTDSDYVIAMYYIGTGSASYVYTIAGTDFWGYAGDGGPAAQSVLNSPSGTAVGSAGNIYIADTGNNRIRKINAATGNISTIAGTGVAGYSGDGGPAVDAQLNAPYSLAFDSSGNLYVSDTINGLVRKIDLTSGTITIYAGSQNTTALGDGGLATSALVYAPTGIAFDSSDNLYICASGRVREVDAKTKIISTVAGNGNWGSSGDGGLAISATMAYPNGVAIDMAGNIYISDEFNAAVRKVTRSTGIITTYAGMLGNSGYNGDGGPANAAKLSYPDSITLDSSGNLYIADTYNFRVRRVDANTLAITTVVGNNQPCFSFDNDGRPATSGAVCEMSRLTFDHAGNLYFAEGSMSRVKKVTAPGAPPTQFTATPAFSVAGGTYATAQKVTITDSTPGAAIYVSTWGYTPPTGIEGYHGPIDLAATLTIKAVALAPGHMPSAVAKATYTITAPVTAVVSLVAGNGTLGFSGAGGPATSAEMRIPGGVAIDKAGNVYIADTENSVVWKVDGNTGIITMFAGTGAAGYTGDSGLATAATLRNPVGVAVDQAGNVYIADEYNNVIREVAAVDRKIRTVAGNGGSGGAPGDGGPATRAVISNPRGVAVDANGNLYITDANNRIRDVNVTTGIIETVAGDGVAGTPIEGAVATATSVYSPAGIFVDLAGDIYLSDGYNSRILKVDAKTGLLHTVAGNGNSGSSGDGLPALEAEIDPTGFTVDRAGNIYISEFAEIRKVDVQTGVISRLAGIDFGGVRDTGEVPALVAGMCPGYGITLDAADRVYFADGCPTGVRQMEFTVPVATPTFSLPAGTYVELLTASLRESTPEATIYYTTDGTSPTASSPVYKGPITLTQSATLTAVAVAPGFAPSAVAKATYVISPRKVTCCTPISPGRPAPIGNSKP